MKPVARGSSLRPKQARFVVEYLVDLNATAAAERAGYSPKVAAQQGYENLRKPEIAAAIAAGKARQLAAADLSASRVLEELRRVALSDVGACFDDRGTLKRLREMPPEARVAIASVKSTKKNLTAGDGLVEDVVELKLWDKVRALELLGKHFALFVEKIELKDAAVEARVARLMAARRRVGDKEEPR